MKRSVLNMPSISFQRSSEGVSSLSNQYQNLILVTCFEVTDFIFSRACLNQNLDTVNSTIDRDLCDTRETKNDISQRIWGIVYANVSKGNVLTPSNFQCNFSQAGEHLPRLERSLVARFYTQTIHTTSAGMR